MIVSVLGLQAGGYGFESRRLHPSSEVLTRPGKGPLCDLDGSQVQQRPYREYL
jgi:hypothetical protein